MYDARGLKREARRVGLGALLLMLGIVRWLTAAGDWATIDQFPTRAVDVDASGEHVIVSGQIEDTSTRIVTRYAKTAVRPGIP